MKIIVNADDYGRSQERNHAIVESMNTSLCSQTTLMVNMPYTQEAIDLAFENGFADRVGLHLNLTLGTPLTSKIKQLQLYCDNEKFLSKGYTSIKRLMLPIHIETIREELEAQIKAFFEFGFTLKHIDSHNWIHLNYPVWLALKPLLEKYRIITVRPMRPGLRNENIKKDWYYILFNKYMLSTKEVKFLPYSSSIEQFLDEEYKICNKYDYIELFTHPNIINDKVMDDSWSYKGNLKLQQKDAIDFISKYEIISYKDIHKLEGR